jgi:peroxiredoxin
MAESNDRLERAGATVVVVSFEARERAAWLRDRLHLPFVIALDPHRNGYRSFALRRASFLRTYTHPGVVSFYARALLQGHIPGLHHGQDRRQLGGDFVLDRDGVIVLAHPERGPEDRTPVGSILRAVEDAASQRASRESGC